MDRVGLAQFLRSRREGLQPEDVGLPRGRRRRTSGLRREEVATLAGMSPDYYARIEQQRGALPSEQVIGAIAAALRLSLHERDHLFKLAGHALPLRASHANYVNPGMMRIFDRLEDDIAQIFNGYGETLRQTRLAAAIFGDEINPYHGWGRSKIYRWFTVPETRRIFPVEDHPRHSRIVVGTLRETYGHDPKNPRTLELIERLLSLSPEFTTLWEQHVLNPPYFEPKRLVHPHVGALELQCQTLMDADQSQYLLVFTSVPGTGTTEKIQFLSVTSGHIHGQTVPG